MSRLPQSDCWTSSFRRRSDRRGPNGQPERGRSPVTTVVFQGLSVGWLGPADFVQLRGIIAVTTAPRDGDRPVFFDSFRRFSERPLPFLGLGLGS